MATGAADGSVPFRLAKIFPSPSTVTSQPASRHHATNWLRISPSASESATRASPPGRPSPICAERSTVCQYLFASMESIVCILRKGASKVQFCPDGIPKNRDFALVIFLDEAQADELRDVG